MLRRLGALLVCASLLTAGCIGSVRAGTAVENRDTAQERAERFAGPDAQLISVNAFEMNATEEEFEDERDDPDDAAQAIPDDTIGDGEAPVWVYTFQTSNTTYTVAVAENGTVLANETEDDVDEDAVPLGEWDVRSNEAAEIVDENEDAWTVGEQGFGFYALSRNDTASDPIWNLGQATDQAFIFARVNAETGEYLGARSFSSDFGFGSGFDIGPIFGDDEGEDEQNETPEREAGTTSGTLTATESTQTYTFEVEEPEHPSLEFLLGLEGQSAGSTVEATVSGPDGEETSLQAGSDQPTDTASLSDPVPGEYEVSFELTQGVNQDYSFDWCAEGEPGDQDAEEICDRIDEAS